MVAARQVTIHDIARHAGVGVGTVSRVINGHPNVSAETAALVREAIAALGYRPKSSARTLRTNRSRVLGFITDTIASTPFAGQIIRGAQETAWQYGKILLLVNTEGHADLEHAAVEAMLERQVEGIVYATMFHRPVTPPDNIYETATVLLDCFVADRSLPAVVPDDRKGGYEATAILIRRGHRRVGFTNIDELIPAHVLRLEGYQAALADHGIPFDADLVAEGVSSPDGGYQATHRLLSLPDRPTAVFCFNDRMAMGAYQAIKDCGLSIPQDVAVIGYDNQELIAANLRPPLSTMELPHHAMGVWAVRYLLEEHAQRTGAPVQAMLECPFVERESL